MKWLQIRMKLYANAEMILIMFLYAYETNFKVGTFSQIKNHWRNDEILRKQNTTIEI